MLSNCLLTSLTICPEVLPTASIAMPEKIKGMVAPINTPTIIKGLARSK
jgi:hypothetical protein